MFFVDRNSKPMKFVQLWTSTSTHQLVKRSGSVGRLAPVLEGPWSEEQVTVDLLARGFEAFPSGGWAQVVVQWPMASLDGTARDRLILDYAQGNLANYLDERGLGGVDGFDRGLRLSPEGGWVQNVFIDAVDGPLASTATMSCLRATGLDPTRATIAWRPPFAEQWTVRYERKANKLPGPFAL